MHAVNKFIFTQKRSPSFIIIHIILKLNTKDSEVKGTLKAESQNFLDPVLAKPES